MAIKLEELNKWYYGDTTKCQVANGTTRNEYEARLAVKLNSQSIENNNSSITLKLQVRSISSTYKTYGYNQTTKIDGTSLSAKSFDMRDTNTWQDFGERTITISHEADGKKSATKSASFTTTATSTYSLKSGSASATFEIKTIPRASQPSLSASSTNIGSAVTIYTNRLSTNFTHTVRYVWGSRSGTIATGVGDNVAWTLPMELCNDIPSSTSGVGTIYVDTYSGGTLVGTKSIGFTGTVPSSVVPSISSIQISEANSGVSALGVFVQGKSKLRVITGAGGSYGSWITSYKITGIDNHTYNSSDFTSAVLAYSGTRTITISVTDSRGRTTTTTRSYTCVAYSNPGITATAIHRCNADGSANDEGQYLKYTFKGNISSINNKNTRIYKIGYKVTGTSTYTYVTISNSSYSINQVDVVLSNVIFDINLSYDIQFFLQDYFGTSAVTMQLSTGFTLMDFHSSGKGMAIGKVSEKENAFEVGLTMYYKGQEVLEYEVVDQW